MNKTIRFLQTVSAPRQRKWTNPETEIPELYDYSVKNRMPYLYLTAISKLNNITALHNTYEEEQQKYLETLDAIYRASDSLTKAGIPHALFKTIRPYESTTVDIDIVILGVYRNYVESIVQMQRSGYEFVATGPRSTTLRDRLARIGVDLYEQIAVSHIVYLDKSKLSGFCTTTQLPTGKQVATLSPEADLGCIIAHSVIKEQMYTLSEYYSFKYYLDVLNVDDFLEIIAENNIETAVKTHATITAFLHRLAHGVVPSKLDDIVNQLGIDSLEMRRLEANNLMAPHKYHTVTVTKAFLEIAKGNVARKSMASQIWKMLNPVFANRFAKEFMKHVLRKAY